MSFLIVVIVGVVGVVPLFAMNTLVAIATAQMMECGVLSHAPIAAVIISANTGIAGAGAAAAFAASKIVLLVAFEIVCSGAKWHGCL